MVEFSGTSGYHPPDPKTEFKKDEYIVLLEGQSLAFKMNFCFKQRRNWYHLSVYKDCEGLENGHSDIRFDIQRKWRYAKAHEIVQYEANNGPFDTSEVEYVKCINLNQKDITGWAHAFTIGRIYKVEKRESSSYYLKSGKDLNRDPNWSCTKEAFEPSTREAFDQQNSKNVVQKLTDDELLAKARKDYPIGTILKGYGSVASITQELYWQCSDYISHSGCPVIYNKINEKWAEIEPLPEKWVPKVGEWAVIDNLDTKTGGSWNPNNLRKALDSEIPKKIEDPDLLQEARDRGFVKGCKYIPIGACSTCTAEFDPKFWMKNKIEVGAGYVYDEGKWATLVEFTLPEITKPESWGVVMTKENKEVIKNWFKAGCTDHIGSIVGITNRNGLPSYGKGYNHNQGKYFDKIISTEEFYRKIGHVTGHSAWQESIRFTKDPDKNLILPAIAPWTVGGYVRLLIDYIGWNKGEILKIKTDNGYTINTEELCNRETEGNNTLCLRKDSECEWIGMEKPSSWVGSVPSNFFFGSVKSLQNEDGTWLYEIPKPYQDYSSGWQLGGSASREMMGSSFKEEEILNRPFNQELVIKTKQKQVKTKLKLEL